MRLASLDRNAIHFIRWHSEGAWMVAGSRTYAAAAQIPTTMPGGSPNRVAPRARTWVWADLDPSTPYVLWFDVLAWRWEVQGIYARSPLRTRIATNRRSRWEADRDPQPDDEGAPNAERPQDAREGPPRHRLRIGSDPRICPLADPVVDSTPWA